MANIIQTRYQALKSSDLDKYNAFESALAARGFLDYFRRSVVKKSDISLFHLPSWIRTQLINFLDFKPEDFDKMPETAKKAEPVLN